MDSICNNPVLEDIKKGRFLRPFSIIYWDLPLRTVNHPQKEVHL